MCDSSRLKVTAEEGPDPPPGVHSRLGPVVGPVYLHEGVPGTVVDVELMGLAVRLECLLELRDLLRGRRFVPSMASPW